MFSKEGNKLRHLTWPVAAARTDAPSPDLAEAFEAGKPPGERTRRDDGRSMRRRRSYERPRISKLPR
jgi:hypothetical protein